MAKRPLVKCRQCSEMISRDDLIEGTDWIMPSKNWFFHKYCYDEWLENRKNKKNITVKRPDEEYQAEIYDYLARSLKVQFDGGVVGSQIKTMQKRGRTLKGILFALIYYYDIKEHPWKPEYEGIWIAELIYDESRAYWAERVTKQKDILEEVEKQIKALRTARAVPVRQHGKKKWESKMVNIENEL